MVDRFPPMLDYDWGGNPSPAIYSGEDSNHHHHHHHNPRQIFDPFAPPPPPPPPPTHESLLYPPLHASGAGGSFPQHFQQSHTHLQPSILYDPRAFGGASSYTHHSLDTSSSSSPSGGFMVVPKSEPCGAGMADFATTIGLNLGGRTYFSASDDDFVNRLYRRSRAAAGDHHQAIGTNVPRCQAEGCNADLSHAKHYHRRHKVCEFHSKASNVIAAGLTQRFCQQCSRFHTLSEFDNGKRSCRKRLADHNRRRRKSHQAGDKAGGQAAARSSPPCNDHMSDSGAQSCSSVTVAISPPRISLDYFAGRQSSTSLFYSSSNG